MREFRFAPLLVVLALGCGGDDGSSDDGDSDGQAADAAAGADGGGDDAAGGQTFGENLISPDCGPVDQPARRISLADSFVEETCAPAADGPVLDIVVWVGDVEAPLTVTFSPEEPGGYAQHCPGGEAPCNLFDRGEVTFETYRAERGASGTYDINDGELTGSFDARWCDPGIICG